MNRASGECEKNCIYYKPITMGREMNEGLPVYKVLKSKTEGSYVIIVSRERTDGKLQYIAMLIDAWKMGLKDCFGSHSITKQDFQRKIINALNVERGNSQRMLLKCSKKSPGMIWQRVFAAHRMKR